MRNVGLIFIIELHAYLQMFIDVLLIENRKMIYRKDSAFFCLI